MQVGRRRAHQPSLEGSVSSQLHKLGQGPLKQEQEGAGLFQGRCLLALLARPCYKAATHQSMYFLSAATDRSGSKSSVRGRGQNPPDCCSQEPEALASASAAGSAPAEEMNMLRPIQVQGAHAGPFRGRGVVKSASRGLGSALSSRRFPTTELPENRQMGHVSPRPCAVARSLPGPKMSRLAFQQDWAWLCKGLRQSTELQTVTPLSTHAPEPWGALARMAVT